MMNEVQAQKKNARQAARTLLSKTHRQWFSDSRPLVIENLRKLLLSFDAKAKIAVLSWIPHFSGEVDLGELADLNLARDIRIFCPRCSVQGDFTYYQMPSDVSAGQFGIPEPVEDSSRQINFQDYDLVVCLIPGLAFDANGSRLGRGKGLYDKFLAKKQAIVPLLKVGICWSFQLFGAIPCEEHDQSMNYILTENELIKTSPEKLEKSTSIT